MSMQGAIPEQLHGLGQSLRNQIETVNGVVATVTSALHGTTWTGPGRDQFENDWNTTFRSALDHLGQAFESAGQDCIHRAEDLQRVMGAR